MIALEDFKKVDLVVGRVVSATRIAGADKLLKLEVDLGEETRTLVAGIAPWYAAESLIGMHIIVVANLQPARIRGVESRGMLLAALDKATDTVTLLTPSGPVTPGSRVS